MDKDLIKAAFRFNDNGSNSEEHLKYGSMHIAGLGPLFAIGFLWLVCTLGLSVAGVEQPNKWAFLLLGCIVVFYVIFRSKLRKHNFNKAVSLRKQLHDLKETEFQLKFQEAKMNGKFERWEKKDDD